MSIRARRADGRLAAPPEWEKGVGATYLDDVATDARSRMGEKEGLSREGGGRSDRRAELCELFVVFVWFCFLRGITLYLILTGFIYNIKNNV